MFYKKINEYWFVGERVSLPNGEELNKNNTENNYGWEWHDEPPQEYLNWKDEQENNIQGN